MTALALSFVAGCRGIVSAPVGSAEPPRILHFCNGCWTRTKWREQFLTNPAVYSLLASF